MQNKVINQIIFKEVNQNIHLKNENLSKKKKKLN
jgi:hypothetical protein